MRRAWVWAATALLWASCSPAPEAPSKRRAEIVSPPKILHFYAFPAECRPGERVMICYGVENADRVAIEPKVRELLPSFNRCFPVTPAKPTVYTLTAAGPGGQATAMLTITVQRAPDSALERPSLLELLSASNEEIAKGQQVTLCYVVGSAVAVHLDPPVRELPPHSFCFTLAPAETTTFTVTAVDEKNRRQSRQVTVRVR